MRKLRNEEKLIVESLLKANSTSHKEELESLAVHDLHDGDMGSIRFVGPKESLKERKFGKILSKATYNDSDGILVSISLNLDQQGYLFELDFWKVDFAPLLKYPTPADINIEKKQE